MLNDQSSFIRRKRSIRIADFELPRGEVKIEALMGMPREAWDHLRAEINRRRTSEPDRPLARCRLCKQGVYIRSEPARVGHSPLYAHFPGSNEDCPWFDGGSITPDDARAAQYQGHQESAAHRRMCDRIAEILQLDERCGKADVDTYRRPEIHKRGRWPDIYAEVETLGRFTLEVQLSKPFAPEISARHLHYEREGVSLIWIFSELAVPLPQGFHDVITMQRGNAFLFDATAEEEAVKRSTLVLSCYLEDGKGGFQPPRLVTLDDLNLSAGRSVFLEDCRSQRLLARCKATKAGWWGALMLARKESPDDPYYHEAFKRPWSAVRDHFAYFRENMEDTASGGDGRDRARIASLFGILCSIAHSAAEGKDVLYITKHKAEGRLLAMLNSKLASTIFQPYADLIETFLTRTACRDLLERESLRKALGRAKVDSAQASPGHPGWDTMQDIFPEVLDGIVRSELADLGSLPAWASEAEERAKQIAEPR
ncbi:competence protein CoiA family protein [Novosphingobium terrae]|uniref:DUF6035 family protein n=1 Tax=Novosphingobium terrae TaxID=2726189 RepID=UPI00197FE280|nr:DUF6035 family protein [Novosphingobium terrae]